MAFDAQKAAAWASGDSRYERSWLCSSLLFGFHQILPKVLRVHFSLGQFLFLLLKVVAALLIVATPIWIDYWEKQEISLRNSIVYVAIIVLAMIIIWAHDAFVNQRSATADKRRHETLVALEHNSAIGKLEEVITLKAGRVNDAKKDQLVDFILNCIDHKTRTFLNQYKESYFQVTLMVFQDSQGMQFLIKSRSTPSRPTGVTVDARQSAAYYMARSNRGCRAVHDLKNDKVFPYEGLSDKKKPPYRSIMMLPILHDIPMGQGNGQLCLGVLSLDTAKPYEFWGAVGEDLTTELKPYTRLLSLLLDKSNGVPC